MKFSLALLVPVAGVLAAPTPPGIPSDSTARSLLSGLTVAASTNTDTYDRDLFPHWETYEGACNTREYVLKRDGTSVVTNSACAATSGTWKSPYDGATWTQASDIDIDHMVPLKNAWISGAASWTTAKRTQFANDVTRPQLWAGKSTKPNALRIKNNKLTSSSNFYCTYAKSWIQVKSYWQLTITSAEKTALGSMLDYC
ncbi:bacterial-type extracellular deoxyribonuclease [Fusarium bulbicola]|nr:bacterial-type extracellular deoxyribonuclease [Fusarium bulbicola]